MTILEGIAKLRALGFTLQHSLDAERCAREFGMGNTYCCWSVKWGEIEGLHVHVYATPKENPVQVWIYTPGAFMGSGIGPFMEFTISGQLRFHIERLKGRGI